MRAEDQSWMTVGEAMIRGEVAQPPVANLVGFQLVALERGKSTMVLEAGEQHANPMGTLHGGILCDVADATLVECEILDKEGNLVARVTSTCMVLQGDRATGR
jgi:acyl-coenzyme A thioesterase PaaI-like protein